MRGPVSALKGMIALAQPGIFPDSALGGKGGRYGEQEAGIGPPQSAEFRWINAGSGA